MEFLYHHIKTICVAIITIGFIVIIANRIKNKVITFKEISNWATKESSAGDTCSVCILSNMPKEVRRTVRRQNGFSQVLNGYKEETSVFAVITNTDNEIIKTCFFMGKGLDDELTKAFANTDTIHLKA